MTSRWFPLLCLLIACTRQPGTPSSAIGGTQWRFPAQAVAVPGSEPGGNTVTFFADGTARFGGVPVGSQTGHWKQDGNELVFDCNDFTEYRVVIDGDRMTGQWQRLKGKDQGQPHATSLERFGAPGR